jgi:hypothetical protein
MLTPYFLQIPIPESEQICRAQLPAFGATPLKTTEGILSPESDLELLFEQALRAVVRTTPKISRLRRTFLAKALHLLYRLRVMMLWV